MENQEAESRLGRYAKLGLGIFISAGVSLVALTEIYKWRAREHHYHDVTILDIDTTYNQYAEPRIPKKSYRLYTDRIKLPVDVPAEQWDTSIAEGSTVSIECRRDFPLWGREYDGIAIERSGD
jgi:hypothetical protein